MAAKKIPPKPAKKPGAPKAPSELDTLRTENAWLKTEIVKLSEVRDAVATKPHVTKCPICNAAIQCAGTA